jgi:hypothetical protein
MDNDENSENDRVLTLEYGRGIACTGARETDSDKATVERLQMNDFAVTVNKLNGVSIKSIKQVRPPEPDFIGLLNGKEIKVEVTEFIDADALEQAKYIRVNPGHELHKKVLTFDTSNEWFTKFLNAAISKKDDIYNKKNINVDMLLIWNEALDLTKEDTDKWLRNFEVPTLKSIGAIYFQSWYHPRYLGPRTIWSLIEHTDIGPINPVRNPSAP